MELALIERFLTVGCSDPSCRHCSLRRGRRALLLAGFAGGAGAVALLALLVLILQLMGVQ